MGLRARRQLGVHHGTQHFGKPAGRDVAIETPLGELARPHAHRRQFSRLRGRLPDNTSETVGVAGLDHNWTGNGWRNHAHNFTR